MAIRAGPQHALEPVEPVPKDVRLRYLIPLAAPQSQFRE